MKRSVDRMVIYQVYPKSFQDTDGDGIGDIRGIIDHVDYLAELGVDMVWMNPVFPSPQRDNGYDITYYKKIDPVFGTMEDLEELIEKLEEKDIGLMFDMVLNHSSITHPWFQKALEGSQKHREFYIIREPKENGDLPTNWESKFGGPAWEPFGETGKYYLHLYDVTQADFNWRNEELRKNLYNVVNFWIDKGIKGFRFDVLNVIGKDKVLKDSTGDIDQEKSLYTDTPIVHDYIREMNRNTFGNKDITTVGEMSSTSIPASVEYTKDGNEQLDMVFSFHHLKVDYKNGEKWTRAPFDFKKLKDILFSWQQGMTENGGHMALFWNNHDQPRANQRFGDIENYRYEVSTMLAHTVHMMKGTPYIYQGEEIGMIGPNFTTIDEYNDVESKNAYKALIKDHSEEETMAIIRDKSRDNARIPMQWDDDKKNYGFTEGTPWIGTAKNRISVKRDRKSDRSIFSFYRDLIALRKKEEVIQKGSFEPILIDHPEILGYIRKYKGEELLVLNNFYDKEVSLNLSFPADEKLYGNGEAEFKNGRLVLGPYECGSWIKRR